MAGSFHQQLVVVVFLVVMMMALSLLAEESLPCDGSGCCKKSNKRPGHLNMTQSSDGYDAKLEGMKTFIYHCVENFTSFIWYRTVNSTRVPVKEGGRFKFLSHNQTLQILNVRLEDAGDYFYIASNGTNQVTGNFSLQVDCRDVGPSFATQEQPIQHVTLGTQQTLHCAANSGLCQDHLFGRSVIWMWWSDAYKNKTFLKNGTIDMVDVVCDSGKELGSNCSVHIRKVQEIHYRGEFICRLYPSALNQTVRLVPTENIEMTWLPFILGVAAAVVLVTVMGSATWWRYGHRLSFWCRTLPDRDKFLHDAVIVYGEDHEELALNQLRPKLQDFGYNVMEEIARPGKPEVLEKAEAILSSYCVILTFSDEELQEGSTRFLTDVGKCKPGRSVVFVRCQNYNNANIKHSRDKGTEETPGQENSGQEVTSNHVLAGGEGDSATERSTLAQRKNLNNVWKDERLKAFKILEWPRALSDKKEENLSIMKLRNVEKFWCSLRKNLPRPAKTSKKTARTSNRRQNKSRRDFNSAGSEQGLLAGRRSTDRTSYTSSSHRTPSQPPNIVDDCTSPKQLIATAENIISGDEVDDVFIDMHTEGPGLQHNNIVEERPYHHKAERDDSAEDCPHSSDQDLPAAVRDYRATSPEAFAQCQGPAPNQNRAAHQNVPQRPSQRQMSSPQNKIPVNLSALPGSGDVKSSFVSSEGDAGGRLSRGLKRMLTSQESGYHSISPSTSPLQNTGPPPQLPQFPPQIVSPENA